MNTHVRFLLIVVLLPVSGRFCCGAEERKVVPPDWAKIAAAARATEKRLATELMVWTSVQELPGGSEARVSVVQSGSKRSSVLKIKSRLQTVELVRLVARDGKWYVRDQGKKYVVCCDTGRRSSAGAYILSERGYQAYVLRGGINKEQS